MPILLATSCCADTRAPQRSAAVGEVHGNVVHGPDFWSELVPDSGSRPPRARRPFIALCHFAADASSSRCCLFDRQPSARRHSAANGEGHWGRVSCRHTMCRHSPSQRTRTPLWRMPSRTRTSLDASDGRTTPTMIASASVTRMTMGTMRGAHGIRTAQRMKPIMFPSRRRVPGGQINRSDCPNA